MHYLRVLLNMPDMRPETLPKKRTTRKEYITYVHGNVKYKQLVCRQYTSDGKYAYVHRIIMENYLGRKLDTCEVVHHCNGNSLDNRLENLELMLRSEHTKGHLSKRLTGCTSRADIISKQRSTLKVNDVSDIREFYLKKKDSLSKREFCIQQGNFYNVREYTISRIIDNKIFKNLKLKDA